MPRQMLENLVASESRGVSSRSVMTMLSSAGIQITVIAILIVIPLLATDSMPEPPEVNDDFHGTPAAATTSPAASAGGSAQSGQVGESADSKTAARG